MVSFVAKHKNNIVRNSTSLKTFTTPTRPTPPHNLPTLVTVVYFHCGSSNKTGWKII